MHGVGSTSTHLVRVAYISAFFSHGDAVNLRQQCRGQDRASDRAHRVVDCVRCHRYGSGRSRIDVTLLVAAAPTIPRSAGLSLCVGCQKIDAPAFARRHCMDPPALHGTVQQLAHRRHGCAVCGSHFEDITSLSSMANERPPCR